MKKCDLLTFTLLVMRMTFAQILLVMSFTFTTYANTAEGQEILDKKITLDASNTQFRNILQQIARMADVKFTYTSKTIPGNLKISMSASNQRLGDVLDMLLKPYQIQYDVVGKQIILRRQNGAGILEEQPLSEANNHFLKISGTVTGPDNTPLPFVSVTVEGTGRGTATDQKGYFEMEANVGEVLVFSLVGHKTYKVRIESNTSTLTVKLESNDGQMNEVVVTALGIKREAKQVGYSVQKIGAADITRTAPPNIVQGLMGKAAGLNVSVPNGIEGGSSRIVIRGNNSLIGNNQPLIVIDGIQIQDNPMGMDNKSGNYNPLDNKPPNSVDLGTLKDWGSYLNFINSADIEDVNVLKGPTAAALYGARGANGVILITTKKGSKKAGLGIDYNFSTRWTEVYRFQDLQNEYGYGGAIALWSADKPFPKDANGNDRYPAEAPWSGANLSSDKFSSHGIVPGGKNSWDLFSWYGTAASWGHKLDGTEIIWWDGVKRKWEANPDNIKSFFRTGNTTTHNVAFSGSGEAGNVRVSLSRTDNTAIVPNSKFDQTTVNIGSGVQVSRKVKAEATASYTKFNRLNTPNIGDNNSWTKFMIYGMSRDYKNLEKDLYRNGDGSKNQFNNTQYPLSYPYGGYGKDIYWNTYANNINLKRDQLIGSVKLNADLTSWLNVMGRSGIDYSTNEFETKNTPIDADGLQGQYGLELNKNYTITAEAMATAHKSNLFIEGFTASLTGGVSTWYNRYNGSKQWNKGPFAVPYVFAFRLAGTDDMNTTAPLDKDFIPQDYRSESKINSAYGLMDLSYKNYLFLQVTGRNDWSSTLPSYSNSYFYPSASLSFIFTEAFNMGAARNWLDFGKFRLAFAGSANGYVPYQVDYVYNSGVFGGAGTRTLPQTLPPLRLTPQRSSSFELGTQLGFLDNRISVDFTYYSIKSTSQILSAPLASSSGVSRVTFNTGELKNTGIEFIVRASPIRQKDFGWDIIFNGAHNTNKVLSLDKGVDAYPLGDVFGIAYGAAMQVKVGDSYGTIYGYDYKYKDGKKVVARIMDNSGTQVIGTRYVTTDEPVAIGNAAPKLTGGVANNFRYKNFSLYALVDFKLGGDIYSADYAAAMGNGLSPETLKERNGGGLPYTYPDGSQANHGVILDGVFEDGKPNTDVVNYMFKYASVYSGWSDIHLPRSAAVLENSWAKLREVSLTYDIPAGIIQKTKLFQGLSVSLIGRDLFYLYTTLPDNLNPEGVNGIGNAQGMQWSAFPGTRSFGFSIKVQF